MLVNLVHGHLGNGRFLFSFFERSMNGVGCSVDGIKSLRITLSCSDVDNGPMSVDEHMTHDPIFTSQIQGVLRTKVERGKAVFS